MESTQRAMNKEINWQEHRFESGLIMDVSKCPRCKKPRVMYLLRDDGPATGVNVAAYNKAFKEAGECCNPKCNGHWGTGCWHCHSPEYYYGDPLDQESHECITSGCDNKGTVWRHDEGMNLIARCPGCDDVLIGADQEGDELVVALKKKEFRWGPAQGCLTLALEWCRDNNEHGKKMPGQRAANLLEAGILFWDPKHEMYDIIEPIKSWLEPHKIEPRRDMCQANGCVRLKCDISPEIPDGLFCSAACRRRGIDEAMRAFGFIKGPGIPG